ncbi:MAG TPA: outer membrane protein assembly factor BamB [Chromatiales bacterium]|nr:outer membrane protein assembly factor BamB [Chromatiales bacterium]
MSDSAVFSAARLWLAAVVLLSLAGCSGTLTLESHPTPLERFQPTASTELVWYRQAQSRVDSWEGSPAIAIKGKQLFVAHPRGRVRALDADCGCRLWNVETGAALTGAIGNGGGYLLLGTHEGELLALSNKDGSLQWRSELSSEVMSRPQVAQGVVVVRTNDGKMFGLNIKNGERLWVYETIVPSLSLRGVGAPLVVDDRVFAGFSNGKVAALSVANGKLLWEKVISLAKGRSELERLVDVDAELAYGDGILYAVAFQGRLVALDTDSGRIVWGREYSSYSGISLDDRQLFITDEEGQVMALDRRTGVTLWRQDKLQRRNISAPVIHNGKVVVGDYEGYLHWLSADDGSFVARRIVDDAAITEQPLVVNDVLYTVSHKGTITALRTDQL